MGGFSNFLTNVGANVEGVEEARKNDPAELRHG